MDRKYFRSLFAFGSISDLDNRFFLKKSGKYEVKLILTWPQSQIIKKAIKIELPNRQLYLIINLPFNPPNSEGNKRKSPVQWKDSVTDLVFKTATFYNCRALALKQRTLTCVSLKTISIITCCRHRERGVSCMQLYFNINSPRINKKVGNY